LDADTYIGNHSESQPPSEKVEGKVVDVVEKGYKLADKLVRLC